MPENKTNLPSRPQQQQPIVRREWHATPFRMLERFADEIDSVFDNFGLGRLAPRTFRGFRGSEVWNPELEVTQQHNELVVRADLPGLKKEDITVDITDNDITISGERRKEQETEQGGVYRSERTYGSFSRTIRLPEGTMADQARASFKDGVLEIRMPSPPEQVTRGRRLEIKEGTETKK
jgi:HSP20 family protein